jgi:lipoprotein-anchoring transpeptidase ErfK/SrfK
MLNKVFAAVMAAAIVCSGMPAAQSANATEKTKSSIILKKKKPQKFIEANLVTGSISATKKKSVKFQTAYPVQAQVRSCTSFLQCLFGGRQHRRASVQQASLGTVQGTVLSGKTSSQLVDWNETKYPVGSLIVKTPERALYYVSGRGEAIRYAVGVGREGMQWSGKSSIVAKAEWPSWTPPQVMIEREAAKGHIIPPFMEGGPGNPLGARAMYIGGRMYRVHGTNNEASIGGAVSSGCIRMMNADVIDLYNRVKVGAKIYVYQ